MHVQVYVDKHIYIINKYKNSDIVVSLLEN